MRHGGGAERVRGRQGSDARGARAAAARLGPGGDQPARARGSAAVGAVPGAAGRAGPGDPAAHPDRGAGAVRGVPRPRPRRPALRAGDRAGHAAAAPGRAAGPAGRAVLLRRAHGPAPGPARLRPPRRRGRGPAGVRAGGRRGRPGQGLVRLAAGVAAAAGPRDPRTHRAAHHRRPARRSAPDRGPLQPAPAPRLLRRLRGQRHRRAGRRPAGRADRVLGPGGRGPLPVRAHVAQAAAPGGAAHVHHGFPHAGESAAAPALRVRAADPVQRVPAAGALQPRRAAAQGLALPARGPPGARRPAHAGESLPLDEAGEVVLEFSQPETGFGYGVGWVP